MILVMCVYCKMMGMNSTVVYIRRVTMCISDAIVCMESTMLYISSLMLCINVTMTYALHHDEYQQVDGAVFIDRNTHVKTVHCLPEAGYSTDEKTCRKQ